MALGMQWSVPRCLWILKKDQTSIIKIIWGGFSGNPAPMPPMFYSPKACGKWGSDLYSCNIQVGPATEIYPMKMAGAGQGR